MCNRGGLFVSSPITIPKLWSYCRLLLNSFLEMVVIFESGHSIFISILGFIPQISSYWSFYHLLWIIFFLWPRKNSQKINLDFNPLAFLESSYSYRKCQDKVFSFPLFYLLVSPWAFPFIFRSLPFNFFEVITLLWNSWVHFPKLKFVTLQHLVSSPAQPAHLWPCRFFHRASQWVQLWHCCTFEYTISVPLPSLPKFIRISQ